MGTDDRVHTGVPGLDHIVGGGLPAQATYLIKGQPGTGKTTLGLQFLAEGARRGARCLYLCLAETRGQLSGIADSYGLALDGVEVHEIRRRGDASGDLDHAGYTVFSPAEVELAEIARELLEQLDRVRPARLVLDSLSELRLLAEDPARYRRELLILCDRIVARECTALLIDVDSEASDASVAETLVSGVIGLEHTAPAYGGDRRRLWVRKMRGSRSVGGYHDFTIGERGIEVFPRLVAAPHRTSHAVRVVPSGVAGLDALLGGGLDGGTSTVLIGPAGSGKSTVATQFVATAAGRGESAAMFCFDESPSNLLRRTDGLGIPLGDHVKSAKVHLAAVDPAEFTPGELSQRIRRRVDEGASLVVLDSINGYLSSLPEERFLAAHLHELLAYLGEKGVATILTLAQHGLFLASQSPVDISYVADTVMLFRYYELAGEVKQALSVVKKRTGSHERSFRELRFGPIGMHVGPPLTEFDGVLAAHPVEAREARHSGDGNPRA